MRQDDPARIWTDIDGTALSARPVKVTDVDNVARMFGRLSRESTYFRFFSPLPRVPDAMLRRLADVDHGRRDALVAFHGDKIVAMASYDEVTTSTGTAARDAELAVTVVDAWHHRGVGSWLSCCLTNLARRRGYDALVARTLPGNHAALALIRKLSPNAAVRFRSGEYEARLPLNDPAGAVDCTARRHAAASRVAQPDDRDAPTVWRVADRGAVASSAASRSKMNS